MTMGLIILALALIPAVMTVVNLLALRIPPLPVSTPRIAILVPARDEEETISGCVEAALASTGAEIEVIVLDDGSSDRTAEIVNGHAALDSRVRLETAPSLPAGWNGKQHACHVLASLASSPMLLFIDADVRLRPEGAARLASALGRTTLVSGVPRQIMESFLERLVIPMINALILGYLPVIAMRLFRHPAFGAACGQMIMVDRDAYRASGGHAAICDSMHDGLKLPRLFRQAGFNTDLVDGSALATCRMYGDSSALLRGFLKNATEGMARPVALPIWTVLLFGGQVLPWFFLCWALAMGNRPASWVMLACAAPLAARLLQARRCREPLSGAFLYPIGIIITLAIQWTALFHRFAGKETAWRGRSYQMQG